MKNLLLAVIVALIAATGISQTIPDFPIPICVGSAEVRGDSIYHFGGSASWGGGTRYPIIYKYDGTAWTNYASMPDDNVWGISSCIKGDTAYVYGGYPNGTNKLRIYNFIDNTWQNGANSPNIAADYGHTIEYVNGFIYLFYNGYVYKYNVNTNTWTQATTLSQNGSWLFSTVYQNEVYLAGWALAKFYKYNPSTDQWTQLADLPYFVTGGALRCVDNKIYYAGGTSGSGSGTFDNTLVYDIANNQWSDANITISSKKAYMADVLYKNNFYVIGGISNTGTVDTVEFIVAGSPSAVETDYNYLENFKLSQNYPNPFNPSTHIAFRIADFGFVNLKVYDVLGNEVATLVNEEKPAGNYEIEFSVAQNRILSSGIYFYQLKAGSFTETRKMLLMK